MVYGIPVTSDRPVDEVLVRLKAALADQGFGVLSEIDLAATLRAKIGAEHPPQLVLGVCNPTLADRALGLEESIGLLLPCTVTVRATTGGTTVEALDPAIMVQVTGNPALEPVAREAAQRLRAALEAAVRP